MIQRGTSHSEKKQFMTIVAFRLEISGLVQGVGYRPFVYRNAVSLGIKGWVKNNHGKVTLHIEGQQNRVNELLDLLLNHPPQAAIPKLQSKVSSHPLSLQSFSIEQSDSSCSGDVSIPSDQYICEKCEKELGDPTNRRFQHPFINCCECGPRFSIIRNMPYDRHQTSMGEFELCERCRQEYVSPEDRRFHAQPIACQDCGPTIRLCDSAGITHSVGELSIIASIAERLDAGDTIAIKSIGGYHLICDATNENAVAKLRHKKCRPHKPFAVMFPSLNDDQNIKLLQNCVEMSEQEQELLSDKRRPIVLAKVYANSNIAKNVAPDLDILGAMLPCSPLHHLILNKFKKPIVATSGNINGEPLITDSQTAQNKLNNVTDCFVHNNRDIARPIDDSVMRIISNKALPIRIGRGFCPTEIELPFKIDEPILAVGAHQKSTVSIAWHNRLVVSRHIGDLNSPSMVSKFEACVEDIQHLYGVKPVKVVSDFHKGYASSKWASSSGYEQHTVQHHIAHASAWALDVNATESSLVFVWDGVGLGIDNTLWGGETFWGRPGNWQRVASFRPLKLQGGNIVSSQPWRSAAAMCWQCGLPQTSIESHDPEGLVFKAWKQDLNCHLSSSVGRLFDGASFASLGLASTSYEGQAGMRFECMAKVLLAPIHLPLNERNDGIFEIDWRPLMPMLFDTKLSAQYKSEVFHSSLIEVIGNVTRTMSSIFEINQVGLAGGVFQNAVLVEGAVNLLERQGFCVELPTKFPVNDASISIGQVHEFAKRRQV